MLVKFMDMFLVFSARDSEECMVFTCDINCSGRPIYGL